MTATSPAHSDLLVVWEPGPILIRRFGVTDTTHALVVHAFPETRNNELRMLLDAVRGSQRGPASSDDRPSASEWMQYNVLLFE